ncbi:MAG: LLM class flavin-dependent oxidoreductase [Sphingomonadales bacterium]
MSAYERLTRGNDFLLGTFATNCSGGMAVTKVPERWDASWASNLKLAKMLDEAGIDVMVPIARWVGYGGEKIDFHAGVLETMTWATGLLAHTNDICVFATIHTAANNPVVVAKQLATVDHISGGRVGLNIVAGWNEPEYRALGLTLADDHETRYGYAQEWFDIVRKLWASPERFDWDGTYFHLDQVHSDPKPLGHIPIVNAAGSGQGREFAVNNVDFLFTPIVDPERSKEEVKELKAMGEKAGRDIRCLTFATIVCRETEAEAREYLEYYAQENADWLAVDNLVNLQFAHAQSFPHDLLKLMKDRFAAGHGGFPLVGTPEQVAEGFKMFHDMGFSGSLFACVDYAEEFPFIRDNVLPILKDMGLRT